MGLTISVAELSESVETLWPLVLRSPQFPMMSSITKNNDCCEEAEDSLQKKKDGLSSLLSRGKGRNVNRKEQTVRNERKNKSDL